MTALILGLIAAVCTGLSYIPAVNFLSIIGLVFAIIAWIVGRKRLKANRADTPAKVGMIIGIIITVWSLIAVVMMIVMMIGITALVMAG